MKSNNLISEADVNTATPSLSNAAATWAGWAVTAVTAKFYRSQSDTPKSSNPHSASRIFLIKPASLGTCNYHFFLMFNDFQCSPIVTVITQFNYRTGQ